MRLHWKSLRGRAGNVAMIFALVLPVLVLAAGGAIDFTNASLRRAQLQQAADAAATAAIARYSPGYEAANLLTAGGPVPDAVTSLNTMGVFNANWSTAKDVTLPTVTGNACSGSTIVCRQGANVYSSLVVKATFIPYFLGIASLVPGFQGIKTIPLTVNAQAVASTPTYVNYYILVDVSQSMGIAATATDMTSLYARVSDAGQGTGHEAGCVFGCHVPAYVVCCSGSTQTIAIPAACQKPAQTIPSSNEALAHNTLLDNCGKPLFTSSINLRIDSAISAIQSTITQAQSQSGGYANIQIGLYEINHGPGSGSYITTVSTPSSNYSALSAAAATIDLGDNNAGGYGDTDFDDEIAAFASTLPANGNGATQSHPVNYVFIITDGLSDNSGNTANNHPTAAFNANDCVALQKNATVGVINTTYNQIYNQNDPNMGLESNFASLVNPYLTAIQNNLKACTSGTTSTSWPYYFEASDGPALIAKLQQLFAATQKVAHVSN